jgi:hypothetical protein
VVACVVARVLVWIVPWFGSAVKCVVLILRFRMPSFQSQRRCLFSAAGKKKGRDTYGRPALVGFAKAKRFEISSS